MKMEFVELQIDKQRGLCFKNFKGGMTLMCWVNTLINNSQFNEINLQ